jgi:hypothetical protein
VGDSRAFEFGTCSAAYLPMRLSSKWIGNLAVILSIVSASGPIWAQPSESFQQVAMAFEPLDQSPWGQFSDLSRIKNPCIEQIWNAIPIRDLPADRTAAALVRQAFPSYQNPKAIIIQSGGPHSIAIATTLAELGYQPIFKMSPITGFASATLQINLQVAGAMKMYWSKMLRAKAHLTKDAPPAFILDTHETKNISAAGMPNPSLFQGIGKIVWITEATDHETNRLVTGVTVDQINQWLTSILYPYDRDWIMQYPQNHVEVWQHMASPYFGKVPTGLISLTSSTAIPAACELLH